MVFNSSVLVFTFPECGTAAPISPVTASSARFRVFSRIFKCYGRQMPRQEKSHNSPEAVTGKMRQIFGVYILMRVSGTPESIGFSSPRIREGQDNGCIKKIWH